MTAISRYMELTIEPVQQVSGAEYPGGAKRAALEGFLGEGALQLLVSI